MISISHITITITTTQPVQQQTHALQDKADNSYPIRNFLFLFILYNNGHRNIQELKNPKRLKHASWNIDRPINYDVAETEAGDGVAAGSSDEPLSPCCCCCRSAASCWAATWRALNSAARSCSR